MSRRYWLALVLIASIWGTLAGAAFGQSDSLLAPAEAVIGFAVISVLCATNYVMGRQSHRPYGR